MYAPSFLWHIYHKYDAMHFMSCLHTYIHTVRVHLIPYSYRYKHIYIRLVFIYTHNVHINAVMVYICHFNGAIFGPREKNLQVTTSMGMQTAGTHEKDDLPKKGWVIDSGRKGNNAAFIIKRLVAYFRGNRYNWGHLAYVEELVNFNLSREP